MPILATGVGGANPVEITVQADKPEDAICANDLNRLKALISGIGWDGVSADIEGSLADIGIQYARMINRFKDIKWKNAPSTAWVDKDGKLQFSYDHPAMIAASARRSGAGLHLVFAENVPSALRADNLSPKPHEAVPRHNEYADFVANAIHSLALSVSDQRETIYIEVGNEPDTPGYWYGNLTYTGKFDRYMQAYKTVVEGVRRYEAAHSAAKGGARIRVGGPAATAYSFMLHVGDWGSQPAPSFNWVHRFISTCARENIRMDYVSYHAYANWHPVTASVGYRSFPNLTRTLDLIRLWRDVLLPEAEILVTEWGMDSTRNGAGARQNFTHVGAAQSMAMLNIMLEAGVNRAIYLMARVPPLTDDCEWPAFFTQRGEAAPVWHLFGWIHQMQGRRVRVGQPSLGVVPDMTTPGIFAVANAPSGSGSILIWNTRWFLNPDDRNAEGWSDAREIDLRLTLDGMSAPVEFSTASLDASTCPPLAIKPISKAELGNINRGERLVPRPEIMRTQPMNSSSVSGHTLALRLPKESVVLVKWESNTPVSTDDKTKISIPDEQKQGGTHLGRM
ncbi:MAG: hypothetical protein LBK99_16110 [Opitutaceae bacterium]|jgi:hypothetical protein|nr:hypothetical protein [Opitutaceae bacterium]